MQVLLVEDEATTASFVQRALEEHGCLVELTGNGDEAYELAQQDAYDVIVLDIMLPGRDGLSILRNLREQHNSVPVILMTARSALNERLEGLNLGADDYVTKPFFAEELIARIHAVTRRVSGEHTNVLSAGGIVANLVTREVRRGETGIDLTAREFRLLTFLMRSPGRVLPRTQILEHVWGYNFDPSSNVVEVHIHTLRKKLDPTGENRYIETVRGVGYRFRQEPVCPDP